jgi:hypothetical protein
MMIVYWGMPINVQWHKLIEAIALGYEDLAYERVIELVRMSRRIGNSY